MDGNTENSLVAGVSEAPFFEEDELDEDDISGAFKTSNPKNNRWQRPFLHDTPPESRFRKKVEIVLCVHGWETPDRIKPMTLLVLGVTLQCQTPNFRYQSARMWLKFGEDTKIKPRNEEDAAPAVVAYAPFVQQEEWNPSEESVSTSTTYGGSLGIEKYVNVGVKCSTEASSSYTRTHFDRGTADILVCDTGTAQRVYGVNWYCEQNKLQMYGVKPYFHLAVLIERSHTKDNQPISFSAVFDMRIQAGFWHDFEEERRRFFRLGKPEDDPVYFHPSTQDQVGGINRAGQKILHKVNKERLGDLAEGDHLSKLIDEAGLQPMKPKRA
ncbi:hypothetical protein PT974_09652 [Cladobotryum mycophilum]|uniref:Uncharacterized protein n=1 Tax=Cladobotryum mycophilum TaxID=491253 RepID=A0ABR0SI39_9HYPO